MNLDQDPIYQSMLRGLRRDLAIISGRTPEPKRRHFKWTAEAVAQARSWRVEGLSYSRIGKRLSVSGAAVADAPLKRYPTNLTSGKEVRRNGSQDHDESAGQARGDDADQDEGRNEASVVAGDQEDGQALAQ